MLIQPIQTVFVIVKLGQNEYMCQMVSLSDYQLELKCSEYVEKDSQVSFIAKHFRGVATIEEIKFSQLSFTYQLKIHEIEFQPGLLINTSL